MSWQEPPSKFEPCKGCMHNRHGTADPAPLLGPKPPTPPLRTHTPLFPPLSRLYNNLSRTRHQEEAVQDYIKNTVLMKEHLLDWNHVLLAQALGGCHECVLTTPLGSQPTRC